MKEKVKKITKKFKLLYPNPETELNFNNPFELLVSVVLSAQCTDKKVNEVTIELFSKYPTAEKLSKAKISTIEKIIKQVNYYKTKSKHLINLSNLIIDNYSGQIPYEMSELIKLPGVGNKTASVVLGELGKAYTFPVDTHVFRVSKRLGIADGKNVKIVEDQLKQNIPKKLWRPFHHYLILHGRRVCDARKPNCTECTLNKICDFGLESL